MAKPKKKKFYVVWVGQKPGIYMSWPNVQQQTKGVAGAKYKSFDTLLEAERAFKRPWQEFYNSGGKKKEPRQLTDEFLKEIEVNSIAVDAACSGNPGKMEYRGVWTLAPETEIFRSKVFPMGTNNIGEFLALVHALALFSEKKPDLAIYSDSRLAMGWVEKGQCRTKLPLTKETEYLHQLIRRGEKWLATHSWSNPILKWETKKWGEIPADFGRK